MNRAGVQSGSLGLLDILAAEKGGVEAVQGGRAEGLRVLLVAPAPSDLVFFEGLIGGRLSLSNALSCPEALVRIEREPFDAFLFDLQLGEASVLKFLRTLRALGKATPVIVLGTPDAEEMAVRALQEGACDYLIKGSITTDSLARALHYATSRAGSEQILQRWIRRHRALFDLSVAGAFRLSLDGSLLDCNDSFLRILGHVDRQEALGRTGLPPFASADKPSDWLLELCSGRGKKMILQNRRGWPVEVLIRASVVEGDAGWPECIEGSMVEVARSAEEISAFLSSPSFSAGRRAGANEASPTDEPAAERLAAVGRLAGGVVHDLNNLLAVILGSANLLATSLEDGRLDPRRSGKQVAGIREATLRAQALIAELLGGGRVVPSGVQDLNLVIQSRQGLLKQMLGERIELELSLDDQTPPAAVEAWQIERVLVNLVLNARDAMPEGGRLVVATARAVVGEGAETRHADPAPGVYARLSVSDTGTGIDEATSARAFEPFFTTKGSGEGTGLGLSIVADIVRQSLGGVSLSSEPGRGTRVDVWLPAANRDS